MINAKIGNYEPVCNGYTILKQITHNIKYNNKPGIIKTDKDNILL